MTEPGPFAPPSGALPPRPVEPGVPPVPAAPLPPPTGAPIVAAPSAYPVGPPIAPPPPPRRPWLLPVVIGGTLVALALIGVFVAVGIQLVSFVPPAPIADPPVEEYAELDDLLEGDPGSPVAVEPLECVTCFDIEVARDLGSPAGVYAEIGLTVGDDAALELTAGEDQIDQTKWWNADGGTPEECYFTYPRAPLFFAPGDVGDAPGAADTVFYPQWHSDADEYYVLTEAVRVFDSTSSATAYLGELETAITGCPNYSFPESGWAVTVTPTPALDLPASVASYGWAESNDYSRFYAIDLQRGNLVSRLTLSTDAYGPSESEFRAFAENYAEQLGARAPRP